MVRPVMLACATVILWWGASIPWGMAPWHLIPFMAPGALIGLGTGWAFHASHQHTWTWRTSLRWTLIGGILVAPLITLYIPLQGDLHPDHMLASFVWLAWIAFMFGAVIAIARVIRVRVSPRSEG